MRVQFELGKFNPKEMAFDHHVGDHSYFLKMTSVQIIEAVVIQGIDPTLLELEFNHVGHLDDFIGQAIPISDGKLLSLYQFACRVSCVDSLGPCAYELISNDDRNIITEAHTVFRNAMNDLSKEAWRLTLEDKIPCSKIAGEFILSKLPDDKIQTKSQINKPSEKSFSIIRSGSITMVKGNSIMFNPTKLAGWFYNNGTNVLIGFKTHRILEGRYDYIISLKSPFIGDLTILWNILNDKDDSYRDSKWGGNCLIGGSPRYLKRPHEKEDRSGGSIITPNELYHIIKTYLEEM